MALLLVVAFLFVVVALYLFYNHYYWPYYRLPRLIGLAGPQPEPLFGNFRLLARAGTNAPELYDELYKKYGLTCLLFLGITPMIVSQDPEFIKDVLVRNFDNFVDRSPDDANLLKCLFKRANKSLATSNGEDWRRLRRMLSPSLTGGKLKGLSPLIEVSCKQLNGAIGKFADKDVSTDVTECFTAFSMEVILISIFGRVCNLHNGANDLSAAVNKAFANTFGPMYGKELFFSFSSHASFLNPVVGFIASKSDMAKQWDPVENIAAHLIDERKSSGTSRSDILQYLIDTVDEDDTNGNSHKNNGNSHKFSMDEILSAAVLIILSGMGHNLTFLAYLLATHSEIQDKLIEEIEMYYERNPGATLYEAACNIEYAEMVLRELLRLYPAVNVVIRCCTQTCTTSNGILIPKGSYVYIPAYNIHHNSEFWPDADKFDPERFSPGCAPDSATYLAFGMGPRMCPGKSYSHVKIKMALINLLKEYKFVKSVDTDDPLKIDNYFQLTPSEHLKVKVVSNKQ